MRTVLAIAGKNLLLCWRDRLAFFWWMIGFPLLIAILIGTMFAGVLSGQSQPVLVAVIDEARNSDSREFIAALSQSEILQISRSSRDDAETCVRRGSLSAFVLLPAGFKLTPAGLLDARLPIAVGADPSRTAELAYLQAALREAAAGVIRARWNDPLRRSEMIDAWLKAQGRSGPSRSLDRAAVEALLATFDPRLTSMPESAGPRPALSNVELIPFTAWRNTPRSPFDVCFPLGMIWGLLGLTAEFAMAFAKERETGTWLRLRIAPVWRWQILLGNGLACLVASVGVIAMLLLVGRVACGVRVDNPLALLLGVPCVALCFVGLTMLLSVLGRTESSVGGAGWACLLVMAMLGGGMVPRMFMPSWMETAGNLSPVKWAIVAFEGGIWRGFSLREILLPCSLLLAQGLVYGTLGVIIMPRFKE